MVLKGVRKSVMTRHAGGASNAKKRPRFSSEAYSICPDRQEPADMPYFTA